MYSAKSILCALALTVVVSGCERLADDTAERSEEEKVAATTVTSAEDPGSEGASSDSIELARVVAPTEEGIKPFGVVVPSAIWQFSRGEPRVIPVCWVNPSGDDVEERGWVQDAIDSTWGEASDLHFASWRSCGANTRAVRITIVDDKESPYAYKIGRKLLDFPNKGVHLNFAWKNYQAECCGAEGWPFVDCTLPENRENCIRASAIHEFGHVVALHHEQKHPRAPSDCKKRFRDSRIRPGEDDITEEFDANSVMNYCREDRMMALRLSELDRKTMELLYCKKGESECLGYSTKALVQ